MLIYTIVYAQMVYLVYAVCIFIPAWVTAMVVWDIYTDNSGGLGVLDNEDAFPEFFWTVAPGGTVAFFCYLNLQCLVGDSFFSSDYSAKVIGRQWYWSYETSDSGGMYDSVMGDFVDSVDKPLRLLQGVPYTVYTTSSDVIHSFALPEYNLKMDAIPGRLNQLFVYLDRCGVFVGYCSELCGAGHAYMPIVIESVKGSKSV